MQPETVDTLLAQYRDNTARVAMLRNQVSELEYLLEQLRANVVSDTVRITATLSDMPRGGQLSDPTARLAMMLAEGISPRHIQQVESELESLKAQLHKAEIPVRTVDAWLLSLNEKQRFVLTRKAIDNQTWREIIYATQREFGKTYSKPGIKKFCRTALEKVYAIAGENPKSIRKVSEK